MLGWRCLPWVGDGQVTPRVLGPRCLSDLTVPHVAWDVVYVQSLTRGRSGAPGGGGEGAMLPERGQVPERECAE